MKQLKRKLRQSLAGFLAFCLTMTSFNMVSWADVEKAFDSGNAIFMISGEDLRSSAQAAIDAGETFQVDDLGLGDEDQSLKREYEKLFGKGRVYEFSPDYYLDEEASADGAELRMFIRTADTEGEYLLTGDEEVIFLYVNESDEKITFRSNIDGYLTQKVSVKAFSEGTAAIPNVPEVQPEPTLPDESAVNPEETETAEETKAEEETEAVDETEDAEETGSTEETEDGNVEESSEAEDGTEDAEDGSGAESGSDETADDEDQADSEGSSDDVNTGSEDSDAGSSDDGGSEAENTDSGSSNEGSGAQASISRHMLSILTSSDVTALEEGTPSEAETEEEEDNFFISDKGKIFGLIDLEDSYTARAFVIRLNELMKNTETVASSSNAAVTVQFLKAEDHEKIKPDAVYNVENSSYEVGDEVDVTGFADEISGYEFAYFELEDMSEERYLTLESDNLIKLYYNQTEVQDGYQIQMIHKLSADEKEYYQRIFVDLKDEDFDEDGNYNYSDSVIKMDGVEAVTDISSMIINKAQFGENSIAETIIEYRLLEGWSVQEVEVKSRMLMAASPEVWPQVVPTGYTVSVENNGPGTTTLTYGTTVTTIPVGEKTDISGIASKGSVILTFIPNANYALGMLRVNGETISLSSVSGRNTYTISNIQKNFSVEVIYAEMKKSTLNWKRSDKSNSDASSDRTETEVRSYSDKKREFTWDQMRRLNPQYSAWDKGGYYNGYVGNNHSFTHDFATWKMKSKNYDLRRFRTTFTIPDGYSAQDYIRLQTVTQDRYSDLGNDGKIIPINDDIFVFVYKQGTTITDSNKKNYLAFWTGTEPGSKYLGKEATAATHADRAVIPYTDGWYCEAELDNVGASLASNYPTAKAGDTFVLDVFVGEYAEGGGMDALDLSFVKSEGYGVTVNYYQDSLDNLIRKESIKGLSLGEIIDLSIYGDGTYLNKYKPDGYDTGVQTPATYKVIGENGTINVIYSKTYRTVNVEYYTRENSAAQRVRVGTLANQQFADGLTYAQAVDTNKLSSFIGNADAYDSGVVINPTKKIDKNTKVIEIEYTKKAVYPLTYYTNAPENTVTNMPAGGNYYAGQNVTVGTAPSRPGYRFDGWAEAANTAVKYQPNAHFTMPANSVDLFAVWTAQTAQYQIQYYFEQPGGSFAIDPKKTETNLATTGTIVNADINKTFEGYFYDSTQPNVTSGTVNEDGGLVLKLYYKQMKPITVKPKDAEKAYDGKPLTSNELDPVIGLVPGDVISITTTGSITNVSESVSGNNPIGNITITRNGVEVSSQYQITRQPGTLTITRAEVIVTADNKIREYGNVNQTLTHDGGKGFIGSSDSLQTLGVVPTLETDATQYSDVDKYPIVFTNPITEAGNYNIVYVPGELTVTQNTTPITITASSVGRSYNGEDLRSSDFTDSQNLVGSDYIANVQMTSDSVRKNVGKADNEIDSYDILNSDGASVKNNYKTVNLVKGTLTVTKAQAFVTAKSTSKVFGENNPKLEYETSGFVSGESVIYWGIEPTLITTAKKNSPAGNSYPITFKNPVTSIDNYDITYINGTLTVKPIAEELVFKASDGTWDYNGTERTLFEYSMTGDLKAGDAVTIIMTEDSKITDAGTQANEIGTVTIKNQAGVDVTESYNVKTEAGLLTVNKVKVTVTADNKEKQYGTSNPELTYTEAGFVNGESLKGLNMKPTLATDANENSVVGEYPITITNSNNPANYEIEYKPGTLKVIKHQNEVKITANNAEKTYDGSALTNDGYDVEGLLPGHKLSNVKMTSDSTITNAGSTKNKIESYEILDQNDNSVTDQYAAVTKEEGTLTINKAEATVKARSFTREYGKDLPTLTYDISGFKNGETPDNLNLGLTLKTDATKTSKPEVYDINFAAQPDAENYDITYVPGTLTITANKTKITLIASRAVKKYDGTELKNSAYTTLGKLVNGDKVVSVTMKATSTITESGTQSNEIDSVVIKNAAGQIVTRNYSNITFASGTLIVSKAELTITALDGEKKYGDENPSLEYEVTGYPETGEPLEDSFIEAIKLETTANRNSPAGTYDITFKDPKEESKNYTIVYIPGKLTVGAFEEEIVFTASDAEKVYDGAELTKAEYSMAGELKPGDRIAKVVMTEDSKITNAGTRANKISYVVIENESGENVTESYGLILREGILTIHKANITVTAANKSKTQGNTNPELTYTIQGLVNGETPEKLGFKPQLTTNAVGTSAAGTYAITFIDPISELENYHVSYKDGILTVDRRNTGGGGSGSGGGGSSPNPGTPFVPGGPGALVTIDPGQIPLANLPEENAADQLVLIEDDQIPLAGLPKTGDRNVIPNLAAIISGVLLAAYAMITGKKKEEN